MDNNNAPLRFRDERKGYNKEDVNNYIESLNKKFLTIENEYKKTIAAQNIEIEKLSSETTNVQKESVSENQTIIDELIEKNNECNKIINALRDTVEKSNNEKSELYLELQKVKVNLNDLNELLNNTDVIQQKADSYDKMSSQIGSMIIFANEKADDIIASANNQAEDILTQTNITIEDMKTKAKENIDELIEKAKKHIIESNENYINHCTAYESEIKNYLNDFVQTVKEKSDNIITKISNEINSINFEG